MENKQVKAVLDAAEKKISEITGMKAKLEVKLTFDPSRYVSTVNFHLKVHRAVCQELQLELKRLQGRSRERHLVDGRRIIVGLIYDVLEIPVSLHTVGASMGGRDHSSILHLRDTHRDLNETDKYYRNKFERCKNAVLQSNFIHEKKI